jgi:hypothetical protein
MSFLGRLTRVHVLIAACVVFVAVGVSFMVFVFRPRLDTLRQTRIDINTQRAEAEKLPQALVELAKAHGDYLMTKGKFDVILNRQPRLTVNDPIQAAFDLWKEYGPLGTGTILVDWFRANRYDVQGITIPSPPLPPVQMPPLIALSMSGFSLRAADFAGVTRFLRATPQMPRLVMVNNVSNIGGSSGPRGGGLSIPVPITVYIITKNAIPATPVGAAAAPAPGAAAAVPGREEL